MRRITRLCAAAAALILPAATAAAHPHVLVTAKAEIVFAADGRITAIRNVWQFDDAFSAYASQGLDTDGDGKLSDAELAPLAKVNVESLADYAFFTWLTVDGKEAAFNPPDEYWLEPHGGRLTLFFNLPLKEPVAVGADTTLEVFDPEYFVAFTFADDEPVAVIDAPSGCAAVYHPPHELDAATMAILAQIPAEERDLPPELQDAAAGLANLITVACR